MAAILHLFLPLLCTLATARGSVDFRADLSHPYAGSSLSTDHVTAHAARASKARAARITARLARALGKVGDISTANVPLAPLGDEGHSLTVGVGTPPQPRTLIVDTGSDLIWTQCELSRGRTATQREPPLYDPRKSSSFSFLPCSSRLCQDGQFSGKNCTGNRCMYDELYGSAEADGILASDTFTFGKVSLRLGFGCGALSAGSLVGASGLMGLSPGTMSLISQLSVPRFSYCLTPFAERKTSPMLFGAMADLRKYNTTGPIQTTAILRNPAMDTFYYYVPLVGLSLGTKRLRVPAASLAINPDGTGGTIVDSGSTMAHLAGKAFDAVKKAVLEAVKLPVFNGTVEDYELCFAVPSGVAMAAVKTPPLVLHFDGGAAMALPRDNYFQEPRAGLMCLAVARSPEDLGAPISIIGNVQQQNMHVLFDVHNQKFSFAPCGNVGKLPSIPPIPDKDNLVQIISKINSINNANSLGKSPPSEAIDLNASHGQQQDSPVQNATKVVDKQTVPSTMDLLTVLSGALGTSTPETNTSQSQGSSDSSGNNKSKSHSTEPACVVNSHEKSIRPFPAAGVIRSNSTHGSPPEIYKQPDRDTHPYLSLQLFGNAEVDIPVKMDTANKYLSSESSNPMDERSPSSSPPVTRTFFPTRSVNEGIRHPRIADYGEDAATAEISTTRAWCAPQLELFKDSERPTENGSPPNPTYQSCYASTSGSDHSPSTSNSDGQDRTGKIIFKLFGKEPGSIPGNLRDEVVNWLKHSPTEMEGYIRPGCLVLSMYLSMPTIAWDELEENFLQRVNSLVQASDLDFWRKGRFLVRSDNQLVSYKDGMTRLSKSWRTWNTPELTLVTPIAVVGGRKTSLVLKGRNLTIPGTQIHCTSGGKYISKEVLCSAYPGTIYDDSGVETFDLPGEPNLTLGRCFIEVENRFRGNSFPVIFASKSICHELRNLEAELEDSRFPDVSSDDQVHDARRLKPRDQVLHFLNELGWLFQKAAACTPSIESDVSDSELIQFSTARFRHLLLFSNERDWCSLTKTLLEVLSKRSLVSEELSQETLEMLSEIHLLNRAVKRKSSHMVHLLVQFVVICPDNSKLYPFLPNYPGPGGLTPLHLAASIDDAEDIVDALTDDPQQIGLSCWHSVLDDEGISPEVYAKFRNNGSYNELVARKLVDRKNSQVTIVLNKGEIHMDQPENAGANNSSGIQALEIRSCSQCAILESGLLRRPMRSRGLLARPYIHSMLAIAAVCVCVCVFMRALLRFNSGRTFKWERLDFGPT